MTLDFQSTNQSFLSYYDEINDSNSTNINYIEKILQINDESLIGINPWDVILNDDYPERGLLITKINNEVLNNIWYFFREFVRILTPFSDLEKNIGIERFSINDTLFMMIDAYDQDRFSFIIDESTSRYLNLTYYYLMMYDLIKRNDYQTLFIFDVFLNTEFDDTSKHLNFFKKKSVERVITSLDYFGENIRMATNKFRDISFMVKYTGPISNNLFKYPELAYDGTTMIQRDFNAAVNNDHPKNFHVFYGMQTASDHFKLLIMLNEMIKHKKSHFYATYNTDISIPIDFMSILDAPTSPMDAFGYFLFTNCERSRLLSKYIELTRNEDTKKILII